MAVESCRKLKPRVLRHRRDVIRQALLTIYDKRNEGFRLEDVYRDDESPVMPKYVKDCFTRLQERELIASVGRKRGTYFVTGPEAATTIEAAADAKSVDEWFMTEPQLRAHSGAPSLTEKDEDPEVTLPSEPLPVESLPAEAGAPSEEAPHPLLTLLETTERLSTQVDQLSQKVDMVIAQMKSLQEFVTEQMLANKTA